MGVLTVTIKSEGKVMDPAFEILSIDTTKEFNKVPGAELKLIDGNVAKQEFKILDGGFFEPGKKVEIALRYEGEPEKEASVFTGIVVDQTLELNGATGPTLNIELSDEAVKMTNVRKNAVYTKKKDSDIISSLVSRNKLKPGTITATKVKHEQMVQYYATDWDFMTARAEANGHLVLADDGRISVIQPQVKPPAVELELGKDEIYDFDLQVNARNQYHNVSSVAWDTAKQKLIKSVAKGKDYKLEQSKYDVAAIAKSVGAEEATLVHAAAMDVAELNAWSEAQLVKSRLSFLRGWIKIPGTPKIRVGETIELKGVGKHFTGKNIISGVRHEVNADGWTTHVQIGMDACWFTAQQNVTDTPAAGLLPGVNGLQLGVVEAHKENKDNKFLILVRLPAFDPIKDKEGKVWARLASVEAGSERGVFFLPQEGDEVVVGFLNDDPRQAIILGSVHGNTHKIPGAVKIEKKNQKGIFTKSNYQLLFDEENQTITLSSKDNKICIDEKKKSITLADASKNQVELSEKGVMIISAKDCKITVKGDFKVEAKGNVKIKGKKVDVI